MPLQTVFKRKFQDSCGIMLRVSALFFLLVIGTNLVIAAEQIRIGTFRVLSNDEIAKIESALHETYFKDGNPHHYRRHRVLQIDVEEFRALLERDWSSQKEKTPSPGVLIPLFDDYSITVQVDYWIDGNFGVTSVFGSSINLSAVRGSFNAHFFEGGLIDASISTNDGSFLITSMSDDAHYVVFEFDPMGAID